jgi:hypothetical protein
MSRLINRTARLQRLEELRLLSLDGLSAAEPAKQLEVHFRTILDGSYSSFGLRLAQSQTYTCAVIHCCRPDQDPSNER